MAGRHRGHARLPAGHTLGWGHRRRVAFATLLLVAMVFAGLSALAATIPSLTSTVAAAHRTAAPSRHGAAPSPHAAAPSQARSAVPSVGGRLGQDVQAVLDARSDAIRTRDKAAWMAWVDDPTSDFGRRQQLAFDNMLRLPLRRMTYRLAEPVPAPAPQQGAAVASKGFVAKVQGRYELSGLGPAIRTFENAYTFVRRASGWRMTSDIDGTAAYQPWDLPGMTAVRTAHALVLGNVSAQRMAYYGREADVAVARVSAVWGSSWPRMAVLVVPASAQEFGALIGQPVGQPVSQPVDQPVDQTLGRIAAVTQGPLEHGEPATSDIVVLNPSTFEALRPEGRRVVITHEITHVAIRSSTVGAVPMWLSEGMADYVGYAGLDLAPAVVAAELLSRVRAGAGPRALPTAPDFDPARGPVAPAYSASWLAVGRLATRFGQRQLAAFYRDVAAATGSGSIPDPDKAAQAAFPRVLGVTASAFVADWTRSLSALARAP